METMETIFIIAIILSALIMSIIFFIDAKSAKSLEKRLDKLERDNYFKNEKELEAKLYNGFEAVGKDMDYLKAVLDKQIKEYELEKENQRHETQKKIIKGENYDSKISGTRKKR